MQVPVEDMYRASSGMDTVASDRMHDWLPTVHWAGMIATRIWSRIFHEFYRSRSLDIENRDDVN